MREATVAKWRKAKADWPSKVVLMRTGDFYEAYDEDAKIVAKTCGVALTHVMVNDVRVPISGVVVHNMWSSLRTLIRAGYAVAVFESEDVEPC